MPLNATFDANQFAPIQIGGSHPVGNKFTFEITGTEVKPTLSGESGLFEVTFTTPAGSIIFRYNLFNKSPKAVEIANGQLSALCRAVGRFQINFNDDGAALRGGRGMLDVGFQKGHEPTADHPEGGYVEIKKVYDSAGNEPGKPPSQATQQTVQPQSGNGPLVSQTGGGWGQPQGNAQPSPGAAQGAGWQGGSQTPQGGQTAQPNSQQGGTWQPGGQTTESPPWGGRK